MTEEKFHEIADKFGLVKKEDNEYTLPDVHPSDFIMKYVNDGEVSVAMEIDYSARYVRDSYNFEFVGCAVIQDYRVEMKLQYLIASYKLMREQMHLDKIQEDF